MKKLIGQIIFLAIAGIMTTSAQEPWLFNGTHIYNTNTGNVGIGTGGSWSPTAKLHINNGTNVAGVMAESNYNSTTQRAVGYFRVTNSATGDIMNISMRKNGTVHEMLQSCYDATNSSWREYAFLNIATGKYEVRTGVSTAEFLNSGHVLFNNTGVVGIGTTTPNILSKLSVYQNNAGSSAIFLSSYGSGAHALYGQATGENSTAIHGIASGTSGSNYGIKGTLESVDGAAGYFFSNNNDGYAPGVYGRVDGGYSSSCGVVGYAYYAGTGVGAWSYAGNLICAYDGDYPGGTLRFYVNQSGVVYADGGYNTFKKTKVPGGQEEYRTFHAVESTEGWTEDIGSAQMTDGKAVVKIDPVFASAVGLNVDYKVFITPVSEDIVDLVVTYKNVEAFGVKGLTRDGRPANCSFDYRIVAKDVAKRNTRMEVVEIPEPIDTPREE